KMLNESMQGGSPGLGFVLGGTNSAVENEETGLFSYPALRSRLRPSGVSEAVNRFTPVLPLEKLGHEHLHELLCRIVRVHALGEPDGAIVPEAGITFYLEQQCGGDGASKMLNPRDVIRPFVELVVRMEEHPGRLWQSFFA